MSGTLPMDAVLPQIAAALEAHPNLVLVAPPGAGKTTRVPLALLDAPWAAGKTILMLEPRRIAARAAARRMAETLGERVGGTVGYRIRLDSVVGPRTRIEVLTEGILARRLIEDPGLDGVAAVLFDEFHERSLSADVGLALAVEAQRAFRPDLRLAVMSATLDAKPVADLMGDAQTVIAEGRAFPVETRYAAELPKERIAESVARAVLRALAAEPGSILAFLPGEGEIREAERLLTGRIPKDVVLAPLYGALTQAEQDRAIRPARSGARKIVLATSIAETSLTIEGVRIVIDSGWTRTARFDPGTGMTRLETIRVSAAAADQRRGRAGRIEPGICFRLWTEPHQRGLAPFAPPEILSADLAPLALDLAAWGTAPDGLAWLDPPPPAAFAQARQLLRELDALDAAGRITTHGRRMARFGAHPRLAHMMLAGKDRGWGAEAAALAALLGERDIVKGRGLARDADLRHRLALLADRRAAADLPEGAVLDRPAAIRAREQATAFARMLGAQAGDIRPERAGALTALAYPDRLAKARGARGLYLLASGRGAVLPEGDPLAGEDLLAVAALDAGAENARIFLAAPLAPAEMEALFGPRIVREDVVRWDARAQAVTARRRRRLAALVLEDLALPDPDPEAVRAALLEGLRAEGIAALPWSREATQLRAREQFLRRLEPEAGWPDWSDEALMAGVSEWLGPYLVGMSRLSDLRRLDLQTVLRGILEYDRGRLLDAHAPTHLVVPSGSRIPIDYESGDEPVLSVRLQEMFGLAETPRLAGGRAPLLVHLLSPAGRPVQVTRDLASFWARTYADVKKDLKGRYPKHYWPDDPLQATPTARARPR